MCVKVNRRATNLVYESLEVRKSKQKSECMCMRVAVGKVKARPAAEGHYLRSAAVREYCPIGAAGKLQALHLAKKDNAFVIVDAGGG